MTADSMHASHREHRAGRSAPYGAFGRELPRRKARAPNSAAAYLAALSFGTLLCSEGRVALVWPGRIRPVPAIPKSAAVPPPASVGNMSLPLRNVAGPTARLPEMVGRKFRKTHTAVAPGFVVGGHRDCRPSAEPVIRADTRVGLKFLAARQPGSNTRRDSTDGHPRGPFVGSDPPWLFLSHALKHRSGNVPDQRNFFTFAEIQDGRRT